MASSLPASAEGRVEEGPAAAAVGVRPPPPDRTAGRVQAAAGRLAHALAGQAFIVWAPVALGTGILLWFFLPELGQRRAALAAAAALALGGLALGGRAGRVAASGAALIALGLCAADLRSRLVAPPLLYHRTAAAPVVGTLLEAAPRDGGARVRLLILRDATPDAPAVRVHVSVPGPLADWMRPGARLSVPAALGPHPPPMLPGAHDPGRRAWFEGVSATGRATGPPVLLAPAPPGWAPLAAARSAIADLFRRHVGGEAGAVATALVLGTQGQIGADVLEAMRVAGLAHLLTVSGFHVGVAAGAAFLVLRWTLAAWPWLALRVPVRALAALGAGLTGTAYALLAGAEVPAVRAAIVAWVVAVAVALGRNPLSIRLLALAAFLILLLRPEAVVGPSFQLSFAAVLALVLLAQSPAGARLRPGPEDGLPRRAGRFVLLLFLSGLAVELALTPIAIAHFGRSGLYGVIANMLAIPLTSFVIMPLLALTLLAGLLGLAGPFGALLARAVELLIAIGAEVAALPGAQLTAAAAPRPVWLLAAAGGLMLALFSGRLRLLGLAPLAGAGLLFLVLPRADVLVSPDGTHLGILHNGTLHMLRATRGGMAERVFREQANAARLARIDDLPGARCTREACAVTLEGPRPLAVFAIRSARRLPEADLRSACAAADLVVAPRPMPGWCRPRWLRLDRSALRRTGAVAIRAADRRVETAAGRAGDHPWGPSALPGRVPVLLGPPLWRDPLPD